MSVRASDALGAALEATGRVRVRLEEVWRLWAEAAPRLVGHPDQAVELDAALRALAAAGRIELPAGAWDTSTIPPLPRSVSVPVNRRGGRRRDWRRFPWRAELGWVASLPTLPEAALNDLVTIHDWLAANPAAPVVPARYRSAEVFSNEKRLDDLARTSLFGPGRLSFELLRCRRLPPPLPAISVGDGPDILVVENSDTYWVAGDILQAHLAHPIRAVAWGSGTAFPAQVEALGVDIAGQGPVTGTAWYWGDYDPNGVRIGSDAALASAQAGVAEVRPAHGLWRAMASCPTQSAGKVTWPDDLPGHDWLGADLCTAFEPIRASRARVAQEAVPPAVITRWAHELP